MKSSKTISAKQTQADLPFMDSFQDMSSLEDSVYFERDGFAETINDIKAEILSNQDRFKISEYELGLGELKSIYVTNNQKYAIIGTTRDIAIFDIYNKQIAYILKDAHNSDITSLTSTSDDIFLISASSDKSIKVWNLKNRELLGSIQQAQDSKTVSIALTDDERHIIASAGADIAIWSFKEQKLIHTIKDAHEQEITTIKYMTNKNQILSIAADKSINIWKFETWDLVHSFEQAHTSLIIGISLIKNETLAITASQDGSISLWDLQKFEHMCALASGNRKNIEAITLSGDDKFIIYATEDGALNVWDLETKTHLHSLKSQSPSRMCGLTNTKKYLLYINQDGFLYTLSLTGQKKTHVLEDARLTNITDLKISSDDSYVVVTSLDGYMQVWNLHLKECQQTFEKESKKGFRTCAISPDSKFIVSGSKDGTIDLWSLTAKQHIHSFDRFHRGEVLCAVFTQDGSKLISSCAGGIICVWNLQTNELIYRIEDAHKSWISSVVVTNDSKYLISGSHDKSIKIWDFETRVCVHNMVNAHKGTIRAMKLTRNGKMLITAGDEIIKLWDMQTRRLIQQFSNNQQRKGKIHSLAVSEDDQLLIAGDDEHNFTVYSLATKMLMHSFPKNSQLSKYVAITSDNKWIAYSNYKSIKVMENPLTGLSISVSNTLSPFSPFRFLPVIAFLTENDLENRQNLIQSYKNLQIFPYSWNWLHISSIFCPKKEIIMACFESGVSFEIDLFGKTPLHYLLNNESKDFTCINYVIGKLPNILANHPRPMDLLSSMSDIVYKILEVHSPQVVQFLRMCVREPEAADVSALEPFGQIPKDLDICYHLSNSRVFSSEIHDKLGIKEGKRKLLIQVLPFCWDYTRLSQDMHQLVKSLLLIDNQEIFETEAVGLLVNYLWGLNKNFFWILGILFSINTVFISLYAGADDTFQGLEIIIIIFGLFFLFYEIFELCSSGWKTYLSHFWNYIDMFGTILLPSTLIAKRMGLSEDIKIYMFSFNIAYAYCRWLSYFRVFQQTRKLLQIIIEICKDIRSFLMLLGFITMGFALIFQQLDSNHDLTYHLMEAYDILFSDFDATGYSIAQIIYFLIVTIAAPIVLLNMLIAMMSETYTVAQDKFVLTDSIELLQMIDESMSIRRAIKSLKASFFPNKVKVEGNDMTNEHNSLHRVQTKKQYMFFVEEEIEVAEESENANPVAKPVNDVKPSEVKPNQRDEQIDERLRGIEKMLTDMQLSPRLKSSPQEKHHHLLDPNFRLDEVERKVSELSKVSKNIDAKFDLLLSLMKKEK